MGELLTFENLRGEDDPRIAGGAGVAGGEDFLEKINSIITGINTLFTNYERLRQNVGTQHREKEPGSQGDNPGPGLDSQAILKAVDQKMLEVITKLFANQVFNIPINQLVADYGDKTVVEAMEGFTNTKERTG